MSNICPKCNKEYNERPAISRYGDYNICPRCGTLEAIQHLSKDTQDKIMKQVDSIKTRR